MQVVKQMTNDIKDIKGFLSDIHAIMDRTEKPTLRIKYRKKGVIYAK